ncbi:hypothetical protein HK102_009852 [Quaeritorhiza haematococci]|nr:hypothetical protein HK102_009852 [Quaeritorhiza haematococci]
MEQIRHRLEELNEYLSGGRPLGFSLDAKAVAGDIQIHAKELKSDEQALALSLFFHPERGIPQLISRMLGNKDHGAAAAILLRFLAEYISNHGSMLKNHVLEIKNIAMRVFKFNAPAEVKKASFEPLFAILDHEPKLCDAERLRITDLFKTYHDTYVQQSTKLPGTGKIRREMAYCPFVPDVDQRQKATLARHLMQAIETELFKKVGMKEPDLVLVAGAMRGLDNFLFSVPFENENAGLEMLIDHAGVFQQQLYEDHAKIHTYMKYHVDHKNRDVAKLGFRAQDAFLKQIAAVLKDLPKSKPEQDCFWYFMSEFTKVLKNKESGGRELSLAIRGYGLFAGPSKHYIPESDQEQLLNFLLQKCSVFNADKPIDDDTIANVAAFIEAFGNIAREFHKVDDAFLGAVEQIVTVMLMHFPKLYSNLKYVNITAFRELLWVMYERNALTGFWSKIGTLNSFILLTKSSSYANALDLLVSLVDLVKAYQALVLTCVDTPGRERSSAEGDNLSPYDHAYTDYFVFWENLFKDANFQTDAPPEKRRAFFRAVYDQTISTILQLPQRLNLSTLEPDFGGEGSEGSSAEAASTMKVTNVPSSGNVASLQPANARDFGIFVNFVEFCKLFLNRVRVKDFNRWAYIFGESWIRLSSTYPMVSGFYKLFGIGLSICAKTKFFDDALKPELLGLSHEGTDEELSNNVTSLQRSCYILFTKYIKEVLVRMQQYKDELLASCIQVVLSIPKELVSVPDLVAPMQLALKLGLSYPPLANVALDALESWMAAMPYNAIRSSMKEILPGLSDYLLLDVDDGLELPSKNEGEGRKGMTVGFTPISMHLAAMKKRKVDPTLVLPSESVLLRELQYRILNFLGGMGGDNRLMLEIDSSDKERLLAWDTEKHMLFTVPYRELNAEIVLDDFLPRVVDLAENSPDRKTKVAACELLHAFVVYMIGKSAHRAKDATKEVKLIHWLTRNSKYENVETMAMLTTCLDAVSSTNGPLRDFGADCAAEFLKYSIKQTTAKEQEENPMNAKSLFKRLYLFCQHSSSNKRFGAALVFNRIYAIFREEESLVDQFAFEILYYLLFSLKLSDGDNPALGTQKQSSDAVDHWQKIISRKNHIFKSATSKRRGFPGLQEQSLSSLVLWLFSETGRQEAIYARKCLELFAEFSRHIAVPSQWIVKNVKTSPSFLVDTLERNKLNPPADRSIYAPKLKGWMKQMVAALDGYTFMLEEHFIEPHLVFNLQGKSVFLKSLVFFVKEYANIDIKSEASATLILTPSEVSVLKEKKAILCAKVFYFLNVALSDKRNLESIISGLQSAGLWSEAFYTLIANCIFAPHILGFDIESEEVKGKLPVLLARLLHLMKTTIGSRDRTVYKNLVECVRLQAFEGTSDLLNVDLKKESDERAFTRVVIGWQIIRDGKLLQDALEMQSMASMGEFSDKDYVFKVFERFARQALSDPLHIEFVGQLLDVCLKDAEWRKPLFQLFLGIGSISSKGPTRQEALSFYETYARFFNERVCQEWPVFCGLLADDVSNPVVNAMIQRLMEYALAIKPTDPNKCKRFIDSFVKDDRFVRSYVQCYQIPERRDSMLRLWKKLLQVNHRIFWYQGVNSPFSVAFLDGFLSLISASVPLSTKIEALDMLPAFLMEKGGHVEKIENCLNEMVVNQFPMSWKELTEGSPQYNDYLSAIEKLLNAWQVTGSLTIIKVLMPHISRQKDHLSMGEIQRSVESAVANLSDDQCKEISSYCFSQARTDWYPMDVRKNIVDHFLLPTLRGGPVSFVRDVFSAEVKDIMSRLQEPVARKTEDIRAQLLQKTFYVHSKTGKVVIGYVGKEAPADSVITKDVIKLAHDAKKEPPNPADPPEFAEIRLEYHQAAYNALTAAIVLTQAKETFYTAFLFKENPAKGELLWDNIVDTRESLKFNLELDRPMLTARLEEYRQQKTSLAPATKRAQPVQYLSSQYLADTSLSQVRITEPLLLQLTLDALLIQLYEDFQSEEKNTGQKGKKNTTQANTSLSMSDGALQIDGMTGADNMESEEKTHQLGQDVLELDDVNKNPCMKSLLAAMEKLHTSVTPPPAGGKKADKMPGWMAELCKKLSTHETHINIRILIAKIVINMPRVFLPYASFWWRPLAQLIADGDQYGEGINYFVQDLCIVILMWIENQGESESESQVKPDDTINDRTLIYKMMSFLMQRSVHKSRSMINNNLKIIRFFVEHWKDAISPPSNLILHMLKTRENSRNPNITAIFLVSIFVLNGISPYDSMRCDVGERQFYSAMIENLSSTNYKDVYSPCAEVLGQLLAFLERKFEALAGGLLDEIKAKIQLLKSGNAKDKDRYIIIVNRISVNFPKIAVDLSKDLLFILPNLIVQIKAKCLEALASAADAIPDLFLELKGKKLLETLSYRDDECQTYTLLILVALAPTLGPKDVAYFLQTILDAFLSHPTERCRRAFFSLILKLLANVAVTSDNSLLDLLKMALLRGLADSDDDVRQGITEYLHKQRLDSDIFRRLGQIMGDFYMPDVEDLFLNYATYLTLELAKDAPDYGKKLFEEGLPNARFDDRNMNIDISWAESTAMQPLFAATQSESEFQRRGTQAEVFIRATQAMQWTPTLESTFTAASFPGAQSASRSTKPGQVRAVRSVAYGLKKRAYKHEQGESDYAYYAKLADRRKRDIAKNEQRQREARARQVSLNRTYRAGELPDIEIKYREIIDPLQALSQRDVDISRQVFGSLFVAILKGVEHSVDMTDEMAETYRENMKSNVNKILQTSTSLTTPFINCILRSIFELPQELYCPPPLISRVSINSSNFHIGVLLLEKIVEQFPVARGLCDVFVFFQPKVISSSAANEFSETKRARTSSRNAGRSSDTWMQIAKLYKSVNNLENFRGILEHHVASSQITKDAINAEILGDFQHALDLYLHGLESYLKGTETEEYEEYEVDIWARARLECLAKLGRWDEVGVNVMEDIHDRVDTLWEEGTQDPCLDYFIRSFLRLKDGYVEKGMMFSWSNEKPNPLVTFLNRSMTNPVRSLHPLARESRLTILNRLQPIREMGEWLALIDAPNVFKSTVETVVHKWNERFPSTRLDSVDSWDDLVHNRVFMLDTFKELQNRFASIAGMNNLTFPEYEELVKHAKPIYYRTCAKAAREQHVLDLARRWLSKSVEDERTFDPDFQYAALKNALAKLESSSDADSMADNAAAIIGTFKYHRSSIEALPVLQQSKFVTLEGRVYDLVFNNLNYSNERESLAEYMLESKFVRKEVQRWDPKAGGYNDMLLFTDQRSFECLSKGKQLLAPRQDLPKVRQKAMLHLASHCDQALRLSEENDALKVDKELYSSVVIQNVLEAMAAGSDQAIGIFPRLLQLIDTASKSTMDTFVEKARRVPSWMFLRWLPQMTALLDKDCATTVLSILTRIAADYPSALYFPLSISSEQYQFGSSKSEQDKAEAVKRLQTKIHSDLLDEMMKELTRLTEPTHIFKDWLDQATGLITSASPTKGRDLVKSFQEMSEYCLRTNPRMGSIDILVMIPNVHIADSNESSTLIDLLLACLNPCNTKDVRGQAQRKDVPNVRLNLTMIIAGKDGAKLAKMKPKEFQAVADYFAKNMAGKDMGNVGYELLVKYSPWLAEFQSRDYEEEMEIPGQYSGISKPRPGHHAKIRSFQPQVLVMGSIRRPKRLTIVGSDEQEHFWLVKGGEDLRLDQRVQQMFSIMNDVMAKNSYCSHHQVYLRTYKVVPMSSRLGIIEWVLNTKPLRDCMKDMPGFEQQTKLALQKHDKFVSKHGGRGWGEIYGNLNRKEKRASVVEHFKQLNGLMSEPYLRNFIYKLSASPEAFLAIRSAFARSMAALNICSYLLGIGDRHTENFLVDLGRYMIFLKKILSTDSSTHIGIVYLQWTSATEVLPVPELAPFRLTNQIEKFFDPLGTSVLLRIPMINVMHAMHENKNTLLNAMDIFIKEPLMEWRTFALKQAKKQSMISAIIDA